ncbi:bacteriocin biosynthesis cyclodehydratase domain-containing protein [Sinosporangium album]|uniref:Bacteriocin biosynthesis cyclodehydratase domain-containing protein n=1 Tax=Sinosporangium album TaxID=504805 RepID=A0A1G7SGS1_9ACTN|nr:YcaO-like family protein [Sinosporangium album]SDG22104.1 bacteriocin biosynthesis cyclodehydratase domain-containing protein [Sinosporangium album]
MITEEGIVRLAPGVRIHVVDDENGFMETPDSVVRLRGTRLRVLQDIVLPRLDGSLRGRELLAELACAMPETDARELLAGLGSQGLLVDTPAPAPGVPPPARVAVCGDEHLARHLVKALERTEAVSAHYVGEPDRVEDLVESPAALAAVATASLFDPWANRVNRLFVENGRPCLFFGVVRKGTAFAGPLWTPDRVGPCYECLRTRVFSNLPQGQTFRSYTDFLAETQARAVPHEMPAWAAAGLSGVVGERLAGWAADPAGDAADRLDWLEEDYRKAAGRHLFPVPTCGVCRASQRPCEPIAELKDAEDERVGIVHAASVRKADSGPPIYLSGSTSADLSLIKQPMRVTKNGGAAFGKKDAVNATIGESLERYAAALYRKEDLVLSTWADLAEEAVPPDAFGLFSDEQYRSEGFAFTAFTPDTPVRWTRAVRWSDGAQVWVPASQVYMHYRRTRGEAVIGPSISTGLAAAPTFRAAVLSGLLEVLERDALAVSWLHRLPPRPVPQERIEESSEVAYHLRKAGNCRVRFYDLSLEHSPVVVAAVIDHRGGGDHVMSFGSACRVTATAALEKAFLEATQGLTYVRRLLRQYQDWDMGGDFDTVDEFNKHAILYTRHPHLREAAGYLVHPSGEPERWRSERVRPEDPGKPVDLDDLDDLDGLVRELDAAGYPVYVVDVTTPDVMQLGVRVVRVLVPGLQHLSGMHRYRMLGTPRLHTVAAGLGHDTVPNNPFPHPLP